MVTHRDTTLSYCVYAVQQRCSTSTTALLVCYAVPVVLANTLHALAVQWSALYDRCLQPAGHLYLGRGLHPALRMALGIIETASSSFRCVSLTLRTVCNAVAGHVLLAVLIDMTIVSAAPAAVRSTTVRHHTLCMLPVVLTVECSPTMYVAHYVMV